MPDHYEILGVAPDASAEDIRAAYLRRARALHPDRQMGRSPAEQSEATRAMVQVNTAWSVLRDPVARRTYDRRLTGGFDTSPTAPRSSPRRSHEPLRPRGREPVTGVPPRPVGASPPSVGWAVIGGAVPYLAILAIGVAIFVITAVAGGPGDVSTRVPAASVCVTIPPSGVPEQVGCSAPNDGQLVAEVVIARVCPSGDRYEIPGGTTALCLIGAGP